jgi:MoxR-like ATPase
VLAAKARSLLSGHMTPSVEDIQAVALPVLRHRIVRSFQAQADGLEADQIITDLLKTIAH